MVVNSDSWQICIALKATELYTHNWQDLVYIQFKKAIDIVNVRISLALKITVVNSGSLQKAWNVASFG